MLNGSQKSILNAFTFILQYILCKLLINFLKL